MRIVFIADGADRNGKKAGSAEAFVNFERDRVLSKWKVDRSETQIVKSLSEVGISSLFGDAQLSIISPETDEAMKTLGEKLKEASEKDLQRFGNPGLIILCTTSRTYTKTVEKVVKDAGGEVIISKPVGQKDSTFDELLSGLQVSTGVKRFLKEYAGTDYNSLLGILALLEKMPARQQQMITVDDLLIRLPTPPGGVPPWEIEKPLFAGNVEETTKLYRRFIAASGVRLVMLSILKKKIHLIYRCSILLESNPRLDQASLFAEINPPKAKDTDSKERKSMISELSTPAGYGFKLAMDSAKRIQSQKASALMNEILSLESKIKSGASGDHDVHFEASLARMVAVLRR